MLKNTERPSMALRFRRSIKLAPGIRMNFGGSGVSWSLGPRGAKVNVSSRGVYGSASAFGFTARERLSAPPARESRKWDNGADPSISMTATGKVREDGRILLVGADGVELDGVWYERARKQHKAALLDLLEREAIERNEKIESLARIHNTTPDPRVPPQYNAAPFDEEPPKKPDPLPPREYGLLQRLFRSLRARVDEENAQRQRDNDSALDVWRSKVADLVRRKASHDKGQRLLKQLYEEDVRSNVEGMERALTHRLERIMWPRETSVSFDISVQGEAIAVDIDLPEIEDMPTRMHSVQKRDMELSTKELSDKRSRELYMGHVHAIGLRIAGEAFAGLPLCNLVVLSAYSQRPNRQTGRIENEYLYSARIARDQWLQLNFADLSTVDPVAAFDRFDTRRDVSKTGVFKAIEPFAL